ncbi:hypothetical protein Syun_020821 [Stephania yunnanensis]|uniref:Uncharacterized protein n=1 Tax=Stephania yunnanensis TaxID=152371 RepID=A0AAP0NQ22_9MAGN
MHLQDLDNQLENDSLDDDIGREAVKPNEKKQFVSELQKKKNVVAMVGDGINDDLCLGIADVRVAMGGGVGAASEVSSVVLMGNRLSQDILPKTGKRTKALADKEAKYEADYEIEKDLGAFSRDEQMEVVYSSAPELVGLLSDLNDVLDQLEGKVNPLNKLSNGLETELLYSVSDPLLIRYGSETEYNNFVYDPLLIRDGSETESNNSVSDSLLIRDGSEKECNYNCTL